MSFPDTTPSPQRVHPVLWVIVGSMILIETLFWAAGKGLAPEIFNRWAVYSVFAFFDSSFEMARRGELLSAQLIWSTLTHAFLHGGWLHVLLNSAVLLGLGHAVTQAAGIWVTVTCFCLTAIAGALTLGVISDVDGPLVGASGAIFGFLGIFTAWQERLLARAGMPRGHIWRRVGGLVLLNVLLVVGFGGVIAWEAHLGGFVMGWLLGIMYPAPKLTLHADPPAREA